MNWHTIEIDQIIWNHLQKYAEPLADTPNSVLHRLLFGASSQASFSASLNDRTEPLAKKSSVSGLPEALSQTLEVVYEVVKMGRTRPDATNVVAKRRGRKPQSILDKYCRQLGNIKAHEFDQLLSEPSLESLSTKLKEKFPSHKDYIDSFLDSLPRQPPKLTVAETKGPNGSENGQGRIYIRTPQTLTTGAGSTPRKKRDPELEETLKVTLGDKFKEGWGPFALERHSLLNFGKRRLLCKYSSFSHDQSKWFWGISKIYWSDWRDDDHLALILENEDSGGYSYLLFSAQEAQRLLKQCSESNGEKKISMRIAVDDNKPYLQEWRNFDVGGRIRELKID
jgi:hypothetical protein